MKRGIETVALIVVALLAGCASRAPLQPGPAAEQISFRPQSSPFCGRCATINVLAGADGQLVIERGHWAGNYCNWERRREVRQITPGQFAAFRGILEPYKPDQNTPVGEEACVNFITDTDGAIVEWIGGDRRLARVFDFGCLDDQAMNEAVRSAPRALGLQD